LPARHLAEPALACAPRITPTGSRKGLMSVGSKSTPKIILPKAAYSLTFSTRCGVICRSPSMASD
jgi:hypothetical protein